MTTIDTNMSLVMIDPNEPLELYDGTIIKGRLEWFLYALCCLDYGNLPTPLSRIEEWANALITNELPNMEPQSRAEEFFKAILTGDTSNLPTPQSRSEVLLDKLARGENDFTNVEKIQSRYEFLLAYLIKNGGGIGNIDYVLYKFQKEVETLYNTKERPVKSAILKGQTLVNLFDIDSVTDSPNKQGIYTDWITFSNNGSANYWKPYYNVVSRELTTGEKLIAFLYVDTNTIGDVTVQAPHNGYYLFPMNFGVISSTGVFKSNPFVINYAGGKTKDGEINFRCITSSPTVGEFKFRLLITPYQDGMENWDIPYFEGMQSVRMPVLTTFSNNLINPKTCLINYSLNTNDGSVKKGSYMNNYFTTDFIEVIEGLTYHRGTSAGELVYYNYNKEYVGAAKTASFTIPKGVKYIRIMGLISGLGVNQYVSIGSTATSYVPYKSNILTTNEDVTLRGIGNVKDELNLIDSTLTSYFDSFYLDGSEKFYWFEKVNDDIVKFEISKDEISKKSNYKFIEGAALSNKLPYIGGTLYGYNKVGFAINKDDYAHLQIQLPLTDENTNDVENYIRNYLKNNRLEFIAPIKEKVVKTVDLTITDQGGATIPKLKTFDKITHVNVSATDILPEVEMEVATTIGEDLSGTLYSTMEDIETKQEALKESNNAQTESINSTMMATTEIYESLL